MRIFCSASGTLDAPGYILHWTLPVRTSALSMLSARHSQNTRIYLVFPRPNWITLHAFCTPLKSRSRPEHNRSNPARTDYTRSKQTPSWSLTLPPASPSLPRARGEAPLYASRRNPGAFEPQSTMKKLNKVTEFTRLRSTAPMSSLIPRWRLWFSWYPTFSRELYSVNHPPGCYPLSAFCTSNVPNEWLRMSQGTASVPACFVYVVLLVTVTLDMI